MIGKVYAIRENQKLITVTFNITPVDAQFTLKDKDKKEVQPFEKHTYKIEPGKYYYSCTANYYKNIIDEEIILLEDEIKDIKIEYQVYGVRRNIATSDTKWERIAGGIDKVANAIKDDSTLYTIKNDFDNIPPWSNIKTCALDKAGNVLKYITEKDWDWSYDYIMVEVPEFWWNREQKEESDGTYEYIYISPFKTDLTPNKSEKFYIGRYPATGIISKLTCISFSNYVVNYNITQFRNRVKNLGTNWGLIDIWRWSYLQMLYLVEYADYDCQKAVGNGVIYLPNNSASIQSGTCNIIKDKSGCLKDDGEHSVVYRGIENLWGNLSQWLDGINIDKQHYAWVCKDRSQYATKIVTSPYVKLGYKDAESSNYIKTMGYDASNPEVQRAIVVGGSDNTYCPDSFFSYSLPFAISVGGNYSSGKLSGLWNLSISTDSSTYAYIGSRLLYIPTTGMPEPASLYYFNNTIKAENKLNNILYY